jgi:hypothetical protein
VIVAVAITMMLRSESRTDIGGGGQLYQPLVSWDDRREFPMLGHIDSYGDTIFNGGQMQWLLSELDTIEARSPEISAQEADLIARIRGLCSVGIRRPHSYLWFIGD